MIEIHPVPSSIQQRRFNLSAQEGDFGYDAGEVLFDKISWEAPEFQKKMRGPVWSSG